MSTEKTAGWLLPSRFFNPIVISWGFDSAGMISAALWYGEGWGGTGAKGGSVQERWMEWFCLLL